jgi:hypothetical protein
MTSYINVRMCVCIRMYVCMYTYIHTSDHADDEL